MSVVYSDFLASKKRIVIPTGIRPKGLSPELFPYQTDVVEWALNLGRAAIFAGTGLGKTLMQLEWAREVSAHGKVLILAPLAVAAQTVLEGARFGIAVTHCHEAEDVRDGINITNYDRMHKFDASEFVGIVLDESSILKGSTGKMRTAIIETWRNHRFRLACTATPAPNDYIEIANHAEFLGVMKTSEMLATYFIHDAGSTQDWRLKGHAETLFFKWIASWAVMFRRPSDLGYSDSAYMLPSLHLHQHIVESTSIPEGMLFAVEAQGLLDRRRARTESIDDRVEMARSIIALEPNEPWLIWCDLNSESEMLTKSIPGAVQLTGSDAPEYKEQTLLGFASGAIPIMVSKPKIAGFGMNFQRCARVMFVGLSDSWESYFQAVRRCWRFGQKREVHCHIIIASAEGAVLANINRKEKQADKMLDSLVRECQLHKAPEANHREDRHVFTKKIEVPSWMK